MPEETNSETNLNSVYNPEILQDLLPLYYKRLFPHMPFYRWMSYGLSEHKIFTHREFSFTLMDDVYIRYLSFETQAEMEKEISHKVPIKIDIGPILNIKPKEHRSVRSVLPVQRELVFDVDMTDYDDVRSCCQGADVCTRCWKFMSIACKVLDAALREDFGYEHILWVFSGRRGIHCWVCDKEARHLDSKGRGAIAEYLTLISGSEGQNRRMTIGDKMHHSVKRAHRIIEPYFNEICIEDQDILSTPDGLSKLLSMVNDEDAKAHLVTELNKVPSSKERWDTFVKYVNSSRMQGGNLQRRMRYVVEEVQLLFVYPRLDVNVTRGTGHLLKAPFCIHPKTGKVSVPFNPRTVDKFDPTTVPTINQLLDEINAFDVKNKVTDDQSQAEDTVKSRFRDYKKTSVYKGIVVFEEFLRGLEDSLRNDRQETRDSKMDF